MEFSVVSNQRFFEFAKIVFYVNFGINVIRMMFYSQSGIKIIVY